jgi:L-ascorbate metabolism protein UlaG (beta-lactamase superfamily)
MYKKFIKFLKYFSVFLFMGFLSSCLFFTEKNYYKGPISDHFDGTKFFNPNSDDPLKKNFTSYYSAKAKYEAENGKSIWAENIIETKNFIPQQSVNNDKFSITFVGHSTFLIQFKGLNILTDPIWSNRASPVSFLGPKRAKKPGIKFEDLPKIDIVLVSHSHYDHLDLPTIKKLLKHSNPKIFTGLGVCYYLKEVKNISLDCHEMDWYDNFAFNNDLTINFLPAKHWSKRALFGNNATLWGAFALQTSIGNIYFAGDTGYGSHFKTAKEKFDKFKIALLPIGAYKPQDFMIRHHISPLQAVMAHQELNAEKSIAMHYETFQLASDNFKDPANDLIKYRTEYKINDNFILMEVGENQQF